MYRLEITQPWSPSLLLVLDDFSAGHQDAPGGEHRSTAVGELLTTLEPALMLVRLHRRHRHEHLLLVPACLQHLR
jgi:hypothetical protein